MPIKTWSPIEHFLYRELADLGLRSKKILLAFSGGLDSVALADMLARVGPALELEIHLAHVHHGSSSSSEQREFRDKCWQLAERTSHHNSWPFVSNLSQLQTAVEPKPDGTSEQAYRQFRYAFLEQWRTELSCDRIVLAHHRDDLLETRLIRLIRGTGPEGLTAMKLDDGYRLRPLLGRGREELADWGRARGLRWLDDPSNADDSFLRNWLRKHWLCEVEKARPGASRTLAQSLERIAQALDQQGEDIAISEEGMDRNLFMAQPVSVQRQWLVRYLHLLNVRGFRQGQVDEIIKRLDTPQKVHKFEVAGCVWHVNAMHFFAKRRP